MASALPKQILDNFNEGIEGMLPNKSHGRYMESYNKFLNWQQDQKTESFAEEVVLAYFVELCRTYKPPTLWSVFSMLETTLNCQRNIDISKYVRLIAFLKNKSSGYKSKKSNVFTTEQIKTFLEEAPDDKYLATKVVLVFGVSGAARGVELVDLTVGNVKDNGSEIIVTVPDSKTKVAKVYAIVGEFADVVRRYIKLRPKTIPTNRFFIRYCEGKCTKQVIGKNTISGMPSKIAEYLKLPDSKLYTGHAYRRTSTTILADQGAPIETLKRHGAWKSNSVAEGYIQESVGNKRRIGEMIVGAINLESSLCKSNNDSGTSSCDKENQQFNQGLEISSQVMIAERAQGTDTLTETISKHLVPRDTGSFTFVNCPGLTINITK